MITRDEPSVHEEIRRLRRDNEQLREEIDQARAQVYTLPNKVRELQRMVERAQLAADLAAKNEGARRIHAQNVELSRLRERVARLESLVADKEIKL